MPSAHSRLHAPGDPTVFLVVPEGFAARYLLRTDILDTLLEGGARVVILAPNAGETYFEEEFAVPGVHIERLRAPGAPTDSRLWTLLTYLRQHTLGGGAASATLQGRYANARTRVGSQHPVVGRVTHLALRALWRSATLRKLLLAVEQRLFSPDLHSDLFTSYQPSLVVTTSPGWFLPDAVLLREARRHGVRTVAAIAAWDNPTSKGYRGAHADRLLAWSEEMAGQLVRHHDEDAARVRVAGVPQFDLYLRPNDLMSRDELCRALGLDPDRRLVFFAARSPTSYAHNELVAERLAKAIEADVLGAPAQLVVRPHPINFRRDHTGSTSSYSPLETHSHVRVDVPEVRSQSLACDVPQADNVRLASILAHSDVVVNAFSTTTLEAFLSDRPVVLVSAEVHRAAGLSEEAEEARDFHRDTHAQEVVRSGAARVARSLDELVRHVRSYIENPAEDHDARKTSAQLECGPTDGGAGRRIGAFLLEEASAGSVTRQDAGRRVTNP